MWANVSDPTGVPSNLNPSVISSEMISPVCLLMEWEYLCRQSQMLFAIVREVLLSSGRMLVWLQEVRMRVFCGLMWQPLSLPSRSSSVRKNFMSLWWIIAEMLSMYANICVRLPNPSSPGSPSSHLDRLRLVVVWLVVGAFCRGE